MATLYLLGTGAAVSDPHRATTMLAFEAAGPDASLIVVDCGGDVVQRLMQAGIPMEELRRIEALILTHEHPDHIGGFPLFIEKIWLAQRGRPIAVYGIRPAIDHARRLFDCFDTSKWTGLPEIEWHEVAHMEGALVLESDDWLITSTPGAHSVPVTALHVTDKRGGGTVAYSCDTSKSEAVARMAQGADILVHEATGEGMAHSSAQEAAEVAQEAGVGRLLLVHIPPEKYLDDAELAKARAIFPATEKGEELGKYEF